MSFHPVDKQVLFSGKKVRLELHTLQDDDGNRRIAEIVVHPGAVVVLAFTAEGKILLIRNRRYSVGQTLWELPAGTLEKGEDPINCAGRELVEETGYLAGRLTSIGNFFSSPGILTEKMYAYAAYDLERSQTALEEGEEIETEAIEFDRAIEMIRDGDIHDGKTIATLLMYDRFHRGPENSAVASLGDSSAH
jgi:ADP-ribose pyrophosphatase